MADLIGKTIDQYQVIELSEDTGNARINKGFQPDMNRYAAIKVLKSQEPTAVQVFSLQRRFYE